MRKASRSDEYDLDAGIVRRDGTAASPPRRLAPTFSIHLAGSDVDATAVAASAEHAYDALVRLLTPLIGTVGVHALTARAVHLASQDYPWLGSPRPTGHGAFADVLGQADGRDPATVAEGAAAVLAIIGTLLVSLIGERLTVRLLQEALKTRARDGTTPEAEA